MPIITKRNIKVFMELLRKYLDNNLEKHKSYLLGPLCFRHIIPKIVFDEPQFLKGCELYRTDKNKALDMIFRALRPCYEMKLNEEREKAMKLMDEVNAGKIQVIDQGSGIVLVESSASKGKFYETNLIEGRCNCPNYTGSKNGNKGTPPKFNHWTGIYDKHLMLAHEIYGAKYHSDLNDAPEIQKFMIKKSDIEINADRSQYFVYGSQKLRIRANSDHPLIPENQEFVLYGGVPEVIMDSLSDPYDFLYIQGPSGCGKTSIIKFLAHKTNTPLMVIVGNQHVATDDFVGCMTAENGTTIWQDGALPEAMKNGYWLFVDEVRAIDPGCLKYLNQVIDSRAITITIGGKPRIVNAHEDFRLICASNPPDEIYKGISEHSFEFIDRFTVVEVDYLPIKEEVSLIMARCGYTDTETLELMAHFANDIRKASDNNEIFSTVTTRALINFARKAKTFSVRTAAEITVFSKMSDTDRQKALIMFNARFGIK